jgi:hypothetical protein
LWQMEINRRTGQGRRRAVRRAGHGYGPHHPHIWLQPPGPGRLGRASSDMKAIVGLFCRGERLPHPPG